ncbi:MAG TPA: TonB-dependent receptor [Terracidiphilus sp.]|nr:TonB-dependent receptor [Terracidiphilus sp.]
MTNLRYLALALAVMSARNATAQQSAPAVAPVSTTVTVLGSAAPISLGESVRTAIVLDTQQHPQGFESIEDYLRTDASVDIQQRAPAGVLSDISVRGASFEQTLVLLNGLRMDSAETSHFNLDLPVPLGALGSIDVLHGAGSTLYGSDAIGGVVDFTTWKPEVDTLRLRAGTGSFGENQQTVLGALIENHWSEVIAGDRDFSTGFIADRDYRTEDAIADTRLASSLGMTELVFAGDDRAFGAAQFYGDYNSWERTKGWFACLTQQFDSHAEAAMGFRRHSDIFLLERDQPIGYKNQHVDDGFEGSLRDRHEIFRNTTLLTGLEEITDHIESTNLGEHGRNRGAGYGEAEWRIPGRGSISAGLREELFSGGRWVTSPTAAATLWLPHSFKLRASAGYGFRIPTYIDLYYSDPTTLGNPNLKPESAWNFENGVDWYPTPRIGATLTVFYSRQKDTIDYTRASSSDPWQASNLPGLHFAGTESALDWRVSRTSQVKFSWTLLFGAQSALHGLESEYVFNYPFNDARAEWRWAPMHSLLLESRLGVVQRYQQTAYPVWDESLAREAGRVRPYLHMTNLSNTGYDEILNVRMPGRSFVGGVEMTIAHKR